MIKLEQLVHAIQSAVVGANDALQGQAAAFLDRFFIAAPASSVEDDKENLAQDTLRPRCVTMEYPTETADGIQTLNVSVPLIAMVPIVHSRIEEVIFRSSLDVQQDEDGDVTVSFVPHPSKGGLFRRDSTHATSTEIEIRIRGDETPDGLRKIVEGYTRALRAQIPG
ncbi:hypothetical protein A167_01617 [Alcanivorax sp. S71-1-4]|uniref:DUF2589 domain-containing protein n=1 Tax=Alcanivorax sp. S71-1-4 TaxID=1177159 RepID=UPI001358820A|nr:DUF2589 domain-containing protein [Alcanivorax sp. S71-1-4]KAF0809546.1 hypothetical protein A167_01617 [Alcanivorax sp. S71-1-4]